MNNAGLILVRKMSVYCSDCGTLELRVHRIETICIVRKGQQYDFINVLVFESTIFKCSFCLVFIYFIIVVVVAIVICTLLSCYCYYY